MSEPIDQQTRLFARVEDSLPVRVRALAADRAADLSRRYQGVAAQPADRTAATRREPAGPDQLLLQELINRVDRLEDMVSRVARAVGVVDEDQSGWLCGETLTISGSGVGVSLAEPIPEGTPVEIELTLTDDPAPVIRATGRVASAPQPADFPFGGSRWRVGIGFTGINPGDREALVRHTFRLQRAQLRERKAETP
jgi:hypothetical protein